MHTQIHTCIKIERNREGEGERDRESDRGREA